MAREITNRLLKDLQIDSINGVYTDTSSTVDDVVTIRAYDVLEYLLETKILQDHVLRSAVKEIREGRHQKNRAFNEKSAVPTDESSNDVITQEAIHDASDAVSESQNILEVTTPTNDKINMQHRNTNTDCIRTRHIALRLYYDGSNFSGLAQNVGQESDNSVERALFQALMKARLVESREMCGYSRCGRTDRGVSAAGQVVAMNLRSAFPLDASYKDTDEEDANSSPFLIENKDLPKNEHEKLQVWVYPRSKKTVDDGGKRIQKEMKEYPYAKILNNLLPKSIRVLGWTPVSRDFSARFSATTRLYRYFFCKREMNLDSIRDGLRRLVGKHDFRNFCKMDVEKVYNFERLILSAELVQIQDDKEVCYLEILGQAFLWHQIRCIAEIIFMVGRGLESSTIITELLDVKTHPRKPDYPLADEKPLVLHDCGYPNLRIGYSAQNLWSVSCRLEEQWEEVILEASRLRNCVSSLENVPILKEDLLDFVKGKSSERRKKLSRTGKINSNEGDVVATNGFEDLDGTIIISWGEAIRLLRRMNFFADSYGLKTSVHIPLLKRSKGPTYEEKIESLKKSGKRHQKFDENVVKKRKTKEEDAAFYSHMTKQGGTAGM